MKCKMNGRGVFVLNVIKCNVMGDAGIFYPALKPISLCFFLLKSEYRVA